MSDWDARAAQTAARKAARANADVHADERRQLGSATFRTLHKHARGWLSPVKPITERDLADQVASLLPKATKKYRKRTQ